MSVVKRITSLVVMIGVTICLMTLLVAILLLDSPQPRVRHHHHHRIGVRKSLLPDKPRLHILSLSFMDQMTWASRRLKSLQCWAREWRPLYDVRVVEPFVIKGAHLGVPIDEVNRTLKFRDIFDIRSWSEDHLLYPELMTWEYFLDSAPRNVIAVQIVYRKDYRCPENGLTSEMCSTRLTQALSRILNTNFTVLKQVCINFRLNNTLTLDEFNDLIFGDLISKHVPITVVFDEWRGMGKKHDDVENQCFLRINGTNCSPNGVEMVSKLTNHVMAPSFSVRDKARTYISKYLNKKSGYLAVMIRWEKVALYGFYDNHNESRRYSADNCTHVIKDHIEAVYAKTGMKTTFLSTDIGKYGSTTFNAYNVTRDGMTDFISYTEDLMSTIDGNDSLSLAEYEQRFEEVGGTTHPAFISQLQKAIAANARCLLLVGWGAFHESTLKMYRELHPKTRKRCFKAIQSC